MSISIDAGTAHSETARLGIREVVRQLNSALGATLVAALAGSKDPKSATAKLAPWTRASARGTGSAAARTQRPDRCLSAEGEHVARLWFVGASP